MVCPEGKALYSEMLYVQRPEAQTLMKIQFAEMNYGLFETNTGPDTPASPILIFCHRS